MGGISFDGRVFEKNRWMGGGCPPRTMGNPETLCLLEEMEGVNDNAGAFMHLSIKINK